MERWETGNNWKPSDWPLVAAARRVLRLERSRRRERLRRRRALRGAVRRTGNGFVEMDSKGSTDVSGLDGVPLLSALELAGLVGTGDLQGLWWGDLVFRGDLLDEGFLDFFDFWGSVDDFWVDFWDNWLLDDDYLLGLDLLDLLNLLCLGVPRNSDSGSASVWMTLTWQPSSLPSLASCSQWRKRKEGRRQRWRQWFWFAFSEARTVFYEESSRKKSYL